MPSGPELKEDITRFCKERGADLVGFAPVERWDEDGIVPPAFRPRALFPQARTVIVISMAMPLPVVETTPSALHKELYDTTNRSSTIWPWRSRGISTGWDAPRTLLPATPTRPCVPCGKTTGPPSATSRRQSMPDWGQSG